MGEMKEGRVYSVAEGVEPSLGLTALEAIGFAIERQTLERTAPAEFFRRLSATLILSGMGRSVTGKSGQRSKGIKRFDRPTKTAPPETERSMRSQLTAL